MVGQYKADGSATITPEKKKKEFSIQSNSVKDALLETKHTLPLHWALPLTKSLTDSCNLGHFMVRERPFMLEVVTAPL